MQNNVILSGHNQYVHILQYIYWKPFNMTSLLLIVLVPLLDYLKTEWQRHWSWWLHFTCCKPVKHWYSVTEMWQNYNYALLNKDMTRVYLPQEPPQESLWKLLHQSPHFLFLTWINLKIQYHWVYYCLLYGMILD